MDKVYTRDLFSEIKGIAKKNLRGEAMKVLQINAVYNLSSTGRTTTELHLAMLNKGIDSYVAYSKTNKPGGARLYHIGSPLDVKLHGLFPEFPENRHIFLILQQKTHKAY